MMPVPHLPAEYRLRLPGPVAVPPRVLQACTSKVLNHRGPEFRAVVAAVEERIRPVLGTENPVLFFAASGTGMMEASLANIGAPGERVLICVNGQFGERFASIARSLGLAVEVLQFEWGMPVDAAAVKEKLEKNEYRAVVVVHNESSTGMVADLESIGRVVRRTPSLLVVDSVSGLGGMPMRQDEWGVDIVVSASQKALMCPPGLGLASIGKKARVVLEQDDRCPRYYWDFRKALNSIEANETPFTTPVLHMMALLESLEMMHEEGLDAVLKRHHDLASAFRHGAVELGFKIYGRAGAHSNTVVALEVPEGVQGGDIVKRLYNEHHTVIAGSRNRLSGKVIRVGTMGDFGLDDVIKDLNSLEEALFHFGVLATQGSAIAVALNTFGSRIC